MKGGGVRGRERETKRVLEVIGGERERQRIGDKDGERETV